MNKKYLSLLAMVSIALVSAQDSFAKGGRRSTSSRGSVSATSDPEIQLASSVMSDIAQDAASGSGAEVQDANSLKDVFEGSLSPRKENELDSSYVDKLRENVMRSSQSILSVAGLKDWAVTLDPRNIETREQAAAALAWLAGVATLAVVGKKYGPAGMRKVKPFVSRITFGEVRQYNREQWIDIAFTPAQIVRHPLYFWEIATEKPLATGASIVLLGFAASKTVPPVYRAGKAVVNGVRGVRDGARNGVRGARDSVVGGYRRTTQRLSGVFCRDNNTERHPLTPNEDDDE